MIHLKPKLAVAAEDADKCEAEDVPEDECETQPDVNKNDKLLKPKH